jgi:signal transduction histidine kinase
MRVAGLAAILKGDPAQAGGLLLLDKLEYTVRGMDRMLHKLMDAAELHSRDLVAASVDLKQAVSSTLADIEALSSYPECEVRTDFQVRAVTLPDRFAFEAVLRNALENALHFRHRGRAHVIEVQAERHGDALHIRIRDNGIGIPFGELDKLGNMFHRATAQSAGMGLGLYVLRMALERVGGRFVVTSAEGLWTEIKVEMPLVARVGVGERAGVEVLG